MYLCSDLESIKISDTQRGGDTALMAFHIKKSGFNQPQDQYASTVRRGC